MRTPRLQLTLALSALVATTSADAQFSASYVVPVPVDTGARVRVSVASDFRQMWPLAERVHQLRGMLRAVSADSLYLELPNVIGRVAVPRESIRRLEVSRGQPSRWLRAIEWGTIGAMILGARVVAAHQDPETRQYNSAWTAFAVGASMGFAAGAYFGARGHRSEQWTPARLRD
jgi:hypothetical protein